MDQKIRFGLLPSLQVYVVGKRMILDLNKRALCAIQHNKNCSRFGTT